MWTSPLETRAFVELVVQTERVLDVPVEALMEPGFIRPLQNCRSSGDSVVGF